MCVYIYQSSGNFEISIGPVKFSNSQKFPKTPTANQMHETIRSMTCILDNIIITVFLIDYLVYVTLSKVYSRVRNKDNVYYIYKVTYSVGVSEFYVSSHLRLKSVQHRSRPANFWFSRGLTCIYVSILVSFNYFNKELKSRCNKTPYCESCIMKKMFTSIVKLMH